ncbi:hypothetical protein ACF0H5_017102 [Mactra antiquata]
MPARKKRKSTATEEVKQDSKTANDSPPKAKNPKLNRKALAIVEDLCEKYGDFEVELNPSAPRRGSFEITLLQDGEKDVIVWTGLKKGPPRKLKFPEAETVITAIDEAL